ncbi:MAG TPA: efflux RND transporter permease subunit [Bacillota bacterium]|nr:efflux RND transporter permease subunit [Bacillota bacterium]
MTLTEIAIKRPPLIIVIFLALSILGLFGYSQLKYEVFPDISTPYVTIITAYPGAAASEVESALTKKIEDAVSTIERVKAVDSTSQEGCSLIMVQFTQNTSLDSALQNTQRKLDEIMADLPEGIEKPVLSKISLNDQPILRIGAMADMPARKFYQFMNDKVKPRLSRVPGAGRITLAGGKEREIKVNVDAQKLKTYRIPISQVIMAVKAANLDFPTGKIKDRDGQYVLRLAGKFASMDEYKQLSIARSSLGGTIKLKDIADVEDGSKEDTSITRVNGKTAIGILIQKQADANSVEVCKAIRAELDQITAENSVFKLKFNIAQDSSIFTIESANAVKEDLGIAILLVALVMLVFLHSIRNSVIVMVAIPASLVSTLIGMWAMGFSLNMVTLLALSLVIGILVDDSIVVLENIYHHLEAGKDQNTAALRGRNEIGFTALSITLVDVVVFLPLAMVTGVIGGIMRPFSMVVVVSTLMSLLVSFTLTPMLASRFTQLEKWNLSTFQGRFAGKFDKLYTGLNDFYLNVLRHSLERKWQVLLLAGLLFLAALSLVPLGFIGDEFIPQVDRGEFMVTVELPSRAKLVNTNQTVREVEKILAQIPEVESVFANIGYSSADWIGQSSSNIAEIQVNLVPKNKRTRSSTEISKTIKHTVLKNIPGVKCRVDPVLIWGSAETPIVMAVYNDSWDDAYIAAQKLVRIVKSIPGTSDVRLSANEGQPEIKLVIDREKMAALGLTMAEVGTTLQANLSGDDKVNFRDRDGAEYTTRIILDPYDRSKVSLVDDLSFVNSSGQVITLKQFAQIERTIGPTKLERRNRVSCVRVLSQAIGRPAGTISSDIHEAMKKVSFPPGTSITDIGDLEMQGEAFASLGIAMAAAIIFVYFIMVALYNSFIYPLTVLFSVPLAVTGTLLALALTMSSLNILTILGLIMQIGLVSKNAILLVDFTNRAREKGYGIKEALMEAGRERLRPILMTTLTMILGMLPIALSKASGAEFKNCLGWGLIGGLTFSMVMTLVVVPVIYLKIDQIRERLIGLKGRFFNRVKITD